MAKKRAIYLSLSEYALDVLQGCIDKTSRLSSAGRDDFIKDDIGSFLQYDVHESHF